MLDLRGGINRLDVGHFEDSSLAAGIDAERTVVKGSDHGCLFEDVVEVSASVTVLRVGRDIGQRVEWISVDLFPAAELFSDEPVHLLLTAVGELVPYPHAGEVEVSVLLVWVQQRPHVREGITLGEGTIKRFGVHLSFCYDFFL